MTSGLPRLVFDGSGIAPEHHFEFVHESKAHLFDTAPLGDVAAFRAAAENFLVDDLLVSRVREGSQTMRRTRCHLDDGTSDWVTVHVYLEGNFTGQTDDQPLDLGPDRIGVVDMARPFAAWGGDSDLLMVGVPRARLPGIGDSRGPQRIRSLARSSLRGRVLGGAIERLWAGLPHARAGDAVELADGLVDTIDHVLRAEHYTPSDGDLDTAVKHYVQAHLDDFDLGVARLQRAFHCSRSALYRLFRPDGGVKTYIREQRLVRCFEELCRFEDPPTPVWRVAAQWGFTDPSYFHRLFVGLFGIPPSALTRRSGYEPVGAQPDPRLLHQVDRYHDWTRATR